MKKSLITTITALSFAFTSMAAINTSTAHAATWHKGIPTILKGKWHTKLLHFDDLSGRAHISFYKTAFRHGDAFGPESYFEPVYHVQYQHTSKGHYKLRGRVFNNTSGTKGALFTYYFKLYNRHQLYTKGSDMAVHTYYKYN